MLLNDMARCQGLYRTEIMAGVDHSWVCKRRNTCARYVERNQGGPRTMTYAYLCSEGDDSYIPAEKPNDH